METEPYRTQVILDDAPTNIPVTKAVRDRLKTIGSKGETYSALLTRLMDAYEPVKDFRDAEYFTSDEEMLLSGARERTHHRGAT